MSSTGEESISHGFGRGDDFGHFSSGLAGRTTEDLLARRRQVSKLREVEPDVRRHAILNLDGFMKCVCKPVDHQGALQCFLLVLTENPSNLNALKNLAHLLSLEIQRPMTYPSGSEVKVSELEETYQEEVGVKRHQAEAYIELAIAFNLFDQHKESECDKAIDLFKKGIELGSGVIERIQVMDWRFSFAFHVWRVYNCLVSQNLGRTKDAEVYFNLAEDQFSIIASQSEEQISDLARLNMFQGRAWTMLGVLLSKGKGRELRSYQKIDSQECFERAKRIRDPDTDPFIRERIAYCCKTLTEAIDDYTAIINENATWRDYERRGNARYEVYVLQEDHSDKKLLRNAIKDLKQAHLMNSTVHYVCTEIALALLLKSEGEDSLDDVWDAAKYADKAEKCLGTQIDINVYIAKARIFRKLGLKEAERYQQLVDISENVGEPVGTPIVDAEFLEPRVGVAADAAEPIQPFTRSRLDKY